jgi:hypothetical protein
MAIKLGLNLNPFVNRFAEPQRLIDVPAAEIGIGRLQLTHEFIDPPWPAATVRRLTNAMAKACADRGVKITSPMIGPSGRLNHFGPPDHEVREYYLQWFRGLVDIAADLGCPRRLADHAALRGLAFLFWEPMSVGRELGHTIAGASALQDELDGGGFAVPLLAMIDIDHGDVSSADPDGATRMPGRKPSRRVRRSFISSRARPTRAAIGRSPPSNRLGRIVPQKLIEAIRAGGGRDNELCMEFAFREREPADRKVIPMIRESVAFRRPFADTGLIG